MSRLAGRHGARAFSRWPARVVCVALFVTPALAVRREGALPVEPVGPEAVAPSAKTAVRQALLDCRDAFGREASDVAKVNALIEIATCQTRVGDIDAANDTLRRAARGAAGLKGTYEKTQSYRRIAAALAGTGNVGAAKEHIAHALVAARALSRPPPKLYALLEIAATQRDAGDRDGAAKTVAESLRIADGLTNSRDRSRELERIARTQALLGDRAAARKTFEQASRIIEGQRPDPARRQWRLVQAHLQAGEHLEALKGADPKVLGPRRTAQLVRSISKAVSADDRKTARQALTAALDVARAIRYEPLKVEALSDVAQAHARIGETASAAQIAAHLPAGRFGASKMRTLIAVSRVQAARRDQVGAQRTVGGARQLAKDVLPDLPETQRVRLRRDLAIALAEAGRIEQAMDVLKEIAAPAREPDRPGAERPAVLVAIARAQVRAGQDAQARETLQEVEKLIDAVTGDQAGPGSVVALELAEARQALAVARADLGDVDGALAVARRMVNRRRTCLAAIARVQAAKGDVTGALSWIAELDSPRQRLSVLQGVIDGMHER